MYVLLISFSIGLQILLILLLPYYLCAILAGVYLLWAIIDTSEWNGARNWNAFRRVFCSIYTFIENRKPIFQDKHIFVMAKGDPFYSIGLHGGKLQSPIYYVVPGWCVWVPIMRDILLWSGAIISDDQYHIVKNMIADGCFVCVPLDASVNTIAKVARFAIANGLSLVVTTMRKRAVTFAVIDSSLYQNDDMQLCLAVKEAYSD